ncbi:hypothetical protein EG68_01355 [Paragonimus skrjabini miyazakii]|uniref:J domain-containing protein n=1 Tax=Paragonimus skrjabini miyazakii TaxID=59628 RepID=A0A8S9Z2W7_9TREM|nr:hypothetical protein EG68_01355 [Paragonimus skrjabini miyazakii]
MRHSYAPLLKLRPTFWLSHFQIPLSTSATYSEHKNYYEILQIKPSASQSDVKNAYLELSKKYHPDAAGEDPSARVKFVEIAEAFSVLGKLESRQEYDAKRKLLELGLFGDGFRMTYPRPSPDLSDIALKAYNEEMRRRWYERLEEWARGQGAYELERGITMDQVNNIRPDVSYTRIMDNETRLYIALASCLGLFSVAYLAYTI